jgi:hypothetical protein
MGGDTLHEPRSTIMYYYGVASALRRGGRRYIVYAMRLLDRLGQKSLV